jgi:hypothetical protein
MNLTSYIKNAKQIFQSGGFDSIMNVPEGRQWFWDLMDKERAEYKKNNNSLPRVMKMLSMEMYADNRERFKKLFGKPSFTFTGEFFYKNYIFEYKGHLFLVGTAKDKGTIYEVCISKEHSSEGVVKEFLEEFSKEFIKE